MGEIFGARQKRMTFIGAVLSLVAAGFVDVWSKWVPLPQTYSSQSSTRLRSSVGCTACGAREHVYEPPMTAAHGGPALVSGAGRPVQEQELPPSARVPRQLELCVNLAAPFFTVHMLKRMESEPRAGRRTGHAQPDGRIPDGDSQWGAIADRFSNKSVLSVCAPLFILCIFAWTFTMVPDRHGLTIPLLIAIHIATGVASAGVTLASGNITLKLAPRGDATAYMTASSLVNSLAAGTASMVGGLTADFFLSRKLSVLMRWHDPSGDVEFNALDFAQWDFFFLLAAVIGLYALHRLTLVREEGHVKEARRARRAVRKRAAWHAQPVYGRRLARGHRVQSRSAAPP